MVAETDDIEVAPSLQSYPGKNDALVQSVPFWGSLFDLVRNYELGVLLVLEILALMRPVTEKLEESSH